jgi:hypothetical protein
MLRRALCLFLFALPVLAVAQSAGSPAQRLVWFAPAPGSLDMRRLFVADEEWPAARQHMDVFKFYQAHALPHVDSPVQGPNTYEALCEIDAFRTVTERWHKQIAIEVASVKEPHCTSDWSGMATPIANTIAAVAAVQAAGGRVAYLAMDEPFLSGQSKVCGGPDPQPTVVRLQQYVGAVQAAWPGVGIGLIEPYPYFSVTQIDGFLARMQAGGIRPAFFHLDIDLNAVRRGRQDVPSDLQRLAAACEGRGIPFGVIIWGNNGNADALYVDDAWRLVNLVGESFDAEDLPRDLIFQSWAQSSTGLWITPSNLPEQRPDTHTYFIDRATRALRPPLRQPPRQTHQK